MSEMQNDFNDYTNRFGLLTEWKNPGGREADNGICHTSAQVLCYRLRGEDTADLEAQLSLALDRCELPGHPGLFNRSPNIRKQIAWDDLIGAAYTSPRTARKILEYGRAGVRVFGLFKLKYFYNNEVPGTGKNLSGKFAWDAWIGRSPSFIAHLHFAAGEKPPFWTRPFWAWTVWSSGTPADQDPWKLTRFLIGSAWPKRELYSWENAAVYKWSDRFRQAWPGGFKDLYSKYYQAGAEHPLSKWWPV